MLPHRSQYRPRGKIGWDNQWPCPDAETEAAANYYAGMTDWMHANSRQDTRHKNYSRE